MTAITNTTHGGIPLISQATDDQLCDTATLSLHAIKHSYRMQPHTLHDYRGGQFAQAWCIRLHLPGRRIAVRAQASVVPPPPGFDFRTKCRGSLGFVKQHHLELVDLVEEGEALRHCAASAYSMCIAN